MSRKYREKAVCLRVATGNGASKMPFAKMWVFSDGLQLKTIQVGPNMIDCPADLYPIGMSFSDAVSPVRKKS
jgi:hypothetical protein